MVNRKLYGFLFSAAFAALLAASVDAKAQTANANAGASSGSNAASGSNSGAAAIVNQNTSVPANQTVTYGGGTNNSTNNSGFVGSDNILRTTPTVYAPPVSGGNPCTLAVSGGVSVIGWGAAAGGTFVDQDCANRQKIAMIWNAGFKLPAKELMCNDKDTYNAFKTAGEPCAFRQAYEPQGAGPTPIVQMAPAPAPAPMPRVVAAPPRQYPRCSRTVVDNCQS